jgi:aminopeptidase N
MLRWIPESDAMGIRVVRNALDLRFDIAGHSINVTDRFTFRSSGQGDFVFRLGDNYKVGDITGPDGLPVSFGQASGVVSVKKPPAGETTYSITYSGVVNRPQFSGSISSQEATLANEYWYPMVARQPAPYTLTVHAPRGWTVVGQGVRLTDQDTDTEKVAQFRMDLPVVYYSLSAGKYRQQSVTEDGRTYTCWSPRMSDDAMQAQAETLGPIIKFYENFGPFPFSGYGDLDSPRYGGGALEAYSYATWGGGLPDEDAHEPSHTWWGGIINNTYFHSFWNESFAVFSEGLYRRETDLGNHEERRMAFVEDGGTDSSYDTVACSKSGADRGPVSNALGYGKGSRVLQMLEVLMGTDSIVKCMNRWVKEQPVEVPGEWEDFERIAEAERPDLHLERFFADWLDRPGHADFDASVAYAGGQLTVVVKFKSYPLRIPLEVLIGKADGTTQTAMIDVLSSGSYSVSCPEKPVFVSLDPYLRLVRPIANSELPPRLDQIVGHLTPYVEAAHADWGLTFGVKDSQALPADPAGAFVIGSPESSPLVARLCQQVGFSVTGNKLTYDGTTIDLDHGGAMALVDLPNGQRCVIGLGKARIYPNFGRARLVVFDDLGRVLRAKTEAKTHGFLTYRL